MKYKKKRAIVYLGIVILISLCIGKVCAKSQIKIQCTSVGENVDGVYIKEYIITKNKCILREGYENEAEYFEEKIYKVDSEQYNAFLKYLLNDKKIFSQMDEGEAKGTFFVKIEVKYLGRKKSIYIEDDEVLFAKLDCFMYETIEQAWY